MKIGKEGWACGVGMGCCQGDSGGEWWVVGGGDEEELIVGGLDEGKGWELGVIILELLLAWCELVLPRTGC